MGAVDALDCGEGGGIAGTTRTTMTRKQTSVSSPTAAAAASATIVITCFFTAGGVVTTTGGPGNNDGDVEAPLFSFGSYSHEFDNASFTFSVESYVGDTRHRRKKRRPNRQYRKKSSVKNSCWYREF